MASIEDIVADMKAGRQIRFADLYKVCMRHFGLPRNKGSSHHTFRTPWIGNPRINIQSSKGNAKAYQVRQVLAALEKLEAAKEEGASKVATKTDKPKK